MRKTSDVTRSQLLSILTDGEFHSGQDLGRVLGVSRAAISNNIKVLCSLGLDIYSVTGKGYRLAEPLVLLNVEGINEHINSSQFSEIEVLNVIGSTNQYLKEKLAQVENGHVCFAEAQTLGRGRHGRKWVSPYGASLYMSMHWSFDGGYSVLGGLSLAVGVAIANALEQCGAPDIKLKWPNDIYAQNRKLAGVLIEVEGQIGSACQAIIGIGINVSLPLDTKEIDQPWIDLSQILGRSIDRNYLAGTLLEELRNTLLVFEQSGLEMFVQRWRELDVYANKPVKLLIGQKVETGVCKGIDGTGALILRTSHGERTFHGGEISVRPA